LESHLDEAQHMIDILWEELTDTLPDRAQLAHATVRLVAAAVLGSILGLQRELTGKAAGLRTHLLVCLGTTTLIVAGSFAGMTSDGLSRIIQGIVTGIGFLGAGTILKLTQEREIRGLTTAASIWMTTAIGITVGLGALGLALMGTVLAWGVLALVGGFESRRQ
jgi:putative Mg2+ transporter-C (MgtC) family protein